jgi:hypothetical protein
MIKEGTALNSIEAKKRLCLLAVQGAMLCATLAFGATTIVVRQDGKGDCTTISAAVARMTPGDTALVYGGVYRESVLIAKGGSGESSRVTIKSAPGQRVVITGSDLVQGREWTATGDGVYQLAKANSYFGDFNPFAVRWQSKGGNHTDFFSCGCVYMNDKVLDQVFKKDDVAKAPNSWFASIDGDKTDIWANFGADDPTDAKNAVEINVRKQCLTAAWNQGYITIDGIVATHGCGPKTIDFWQSIAKPMAGAISTNGGYYWIIENCEAYQNRGVAIDYGNGSHMNELQNGGEPKLYGHHIIRNCKVHDNGTNGLMAYRGAYTEIYGCTLADNNALNTGLLSEAYIKDVSVGFGISIHDNYFYSDQSWGAYPIWLDSECDGSRVSRNVFYCKGSGQGFTEILSEVNHGWVMWDNNVFVGLGWGILEASHNYYVHNLWLNTPKDAKVRLWPCTMDRENFKGTEGWDGYMRAMRAAKPGTLEAIGSSGNPTTRFETASRFNKMLNNLFFDNGLAGNKAVAEVAKDSYVARLAEVALSTQPKVNPDFSGGSWSHPEVGDLPIAWVEAGGAAAVGKATAAWGSECDYNVYCGGASKIDYQYAALRGYEADKNSVVVVGGKASYTVDATPGSFKLSLVVDSSCSSIKAPAITSEYLGDTSLYVQAGYSFPAPSVTVDFFGAARDPKAVTVGPFSALAEGENTFVLWPRDTATAK